MVKETRLKDANMDIIAINCKYSFLSGDKHWHFPVNRVFLENNSVILKKNSSSISKNMPCMQKYSPMLKTFVAPVCQTFV